MKSQDLDISERFAADEEKESDLLRGELRGIGFIITKQVGHGKTTLQTIVQLAQMLFTPWIRVE